MTKKVVYIASVGYSGSTLLDLLLGANSGITPLGEVYLLSRYARNGNKCTCGETIDSCMFWSKVEEQLKARFGDQHNLSNFDLIAETVTQTIFRKLPSLTDIGLVLGKDKLWDTICKLDHKASLFRQAARNSVAIYDLASKTDKSDIVIDSSKYALPLKARYMELKDKIRIIFLIRDGRAVCKSLMKRQGLSFTQAAQKWARFNWNLELVCKTIPKSQVFQLNYEELCGNTQETLNDLSKFIGTPAPLEINDLTKDKFHNIGGNPMRFRREETKISIDESWKDAITPDELRVFDKIAGKQNLKYGYSKEL